MEPIPSSVQGKRILVGVTGGIAAYKVCEVISTLAKLGAEVRAIATDSAQQFITPLSLATLTRHQAYTDQDFWQPIHGRPLHIQLGEWAEVFVIAPLTANTLAKLALGMADNLLTNTVLASHCPVLLVPAMNRQMWQQVAVQRNWQQVLSDPRFVGIAPSSGVLACDIPTLEGNGTATGAGRMAEPQQILAHIESLLHTQGKQDLAGKRVLVSAGSTREYLDPVRFIGNPSTGKMGIAIAQAALHRGAEVTLVHGPIDTALVTGLPGLKLIGVTSAEEMRHGMLQHFPQADLTVMVAAVADVRPAEYHAEKLPKRALPQVLPLEHTVDIVAELAKIKQPHQQLVGFAAQTGDILTPAQEKLRQKKLDAIVTNPVDIPNAGFGSNLNEAILLNSQGKQQQIPRCTKLQLAHHIFNFLHSPNSH